VLGDHRDSHGSSSDSLIPEKTGVEAAIRGESCPRSQSVNIGMPGM
jgi:hypothetical protein